METDYSETSPVVQTTHGAVRGALLTSLYDELYYVFDGIPYAQPPLGELRFRAPQEGQPWSGVLDCTEPREKCLQIPTISQKIEGSEDCLFLNIAVKTLRSEKPLPVMVYVHGGGFKNGDPTRRAFSPDYLMREEVIYISIGYRLGPLGFMSFADPKLNIPGNAGLKDIVMALKWIKANVSRFNGDANNITLFGHSSGSCSVQLVMMSPLSEGLINKVILLGAFMPETNRQHDIEYLLAKHLGYEGENIDAQVYEFLNAVDTKQLAMPDFRELYERLQSGGLPPFVPCVEPYATPTSLLLEEPRVLQRTSWSNRIPLMLGCTSDEGLFSPMTNIKKDPELFKALINRPEFALPFSMLRHADPVTCRILGMRLIKKFCGVPASELTLSHYSQIADIYTHNLLHYQQRMINARLAYSQADTFLYRFALDSPDFNLYRVRYHGPGSHGAQHADELCYLFKIPATFKLDKSRVEYKTICRMTAMFTQFALSSNPNAPLTQSLVNWLPVSAVEPTMCLNIDEELTFIPQPERMKLKFYEQLYRNAGMELI